MITPASPTPMRWPAIPIKTAPAKGWKIGWRRADAPTPMPRLSDLPPLIADRAAVLPYAGYQAGIERKRASAYMDYPSHVHLETMAKCNAACTFCPYPDLERQGEKMDDALIAKVIGDLADIPQSLGFQLSPFKVSEPFLDVRLFDILGDVNTRLPNASLTLTTNGAPVTEKTLTKLSAVRRLGYLWISFNDHREEAYEATMRLPYARTIERLDLIHRWRADGRLPCRVVLSRVGDGSPVDMDFQRWVAATYPAFGSSVMPRGDWIGQVADAGAPKPPNIACSRWFELSITATGVVAHCCMDGHAEHPIGDVRERHALQIYNDPHYRRLREATATRMDASPCDRCSFL